MEYPLGAHVTLDGFDPPEPVLRADEGRIAGPLSGGDLLPVSFDVDGGGAVVLDVPLSSVVTVEGDAV